MMNIPKRLQLVNSAHFLVYTTLFTFSILLSLWLDNLISWSIWFVFFPLWIWKLVVIVGATVGIVIWYRHPEARLEPASAVSFRAMIISTAVHLMLILFEVLICMKLENPVSFFPWTLVFSPLFFLSLTSTVLCIWAVRNDRNFQVELLSALNLLQFAFIAVKLDGYVSWNWLLVFIPVWILLCVSFILALYNIIMTSIMVSSAPNHAEQKNLRLQMFLTHLLIIITTTVYLVLLVEKEEGGLTQYYTVIGIPLYISLLALISLAFSSQPANSWWFGLKKDFCQFLLLDACPCLQEYGNIKYKLQFNSDRQNATDELRAGENVRALTEQPTPRKGQAGSKASKDRLPAPSTSENLIAMPD